MDFEKRHYSCLSSSGLSNTCRDRCADRRNSCLLYCRNSIKNTRGPARSMFVNFRAKISDVYRFSAQSFFARDSSSRDSTPAQDIPAHLCLTYFLSVQFLMRYYNILRSPYSVLENKLTVAGKLAEMSCASCAEIAVRGNASLDKTLRGNGACPT